ncbi:3-dehydroquinate synthetase [Enterococcus sp. PF1-24]|uniref:hypothetical protein n=1 Tax=unclassified Enterococcus TaxID=2608891 RepID=UPI002475D30B|nr:MULTISPECIES: hypothetical protein [unclassified Enterococcus]MDH6365630.1 3-dehydroquinate synthetase [Enterococcus sp. PFB1-1]MDH6402723.1 3-dehydroquinate synthetase [Enterococcus sp. PF1-24]
MFVEVNYQKGQLESLVIYGETFAATLPLLDCKNKHVIFISNQRYYDLFSEKINQLLKESLLIDWYICPNQSHCNTLKELNQLLDFIQRFPEAEDYLFFAFGNEGVIQLTSYLQKNTLLKGDFWVLPVSIRAFAQSLIAKTKIVSEKELPVLQGTNLPQLILYDQTLTQEQQTGKMIDFLTLLTCGIVCSRDFLKELYFNYPQAQSLQRISFSGLISLLITFYQEKGELIESYGQAFEQAFYGIEGSHFLSSSMKKMLGILFHLAWNIESEKIAFNFENFLRWLKQLGFPLELPEQFLLSDYVENLLRVINNGSELLVLSEIGETNGFRKGTDSKLLVAIENYQKIVKEMQA